MVRFSVDNVMDGLFDKFDSDTAGTQGYYSHTITTRPSGTSGPHSRPLQMSEKDTNKYERYSRR